MAHQEIPTEILIEYAADQLARLAVELPALVKAGHLDPSRCSFEIQAQSEIVQALCRVRRAERNLAVPAPELRVDSTVPGVH